jgi:hypothetical protein
VLALISIVENKFNLNNQMSDISINIEPGKQIDAGKPHNDKSITKIEVSPNEKYLVTYSRDDNSIVGWNVAYVDEGQLEHETFPHKIQDYIQRQICVSDDKKLAYIIKSCLGK